MALQQKQPHRFKYQLLLGLVILISLQLLSLRSANLSQYLPAMQTSLSSPPEVLRPFIPAKLSNATLARLSKLELEVTKLHNQKATACRSPRGHSLCARNSNATLVWYNPSNRDRFICNNSIILGPWKTLVVKPSERNECWENAWKMSLTSHSFPMEATVENKGLFPGISIKNSVTKPIDDTFSSNLEQRTFPKDNPSQMHNLYKYNASMGLVFKMQNGNGEGLKGEFGPLRCDIKCDYETKRGLVGKQFVYGTNWGFDASIEGSHYYSNLQIHDDDWKRNKYFMTTSFRSEVPAVYFSLFNNWWGNTLQTPAVNYSKAIKGASFLARNCGAKNNRNDVVTKLIKAGFRVDSLSSCLHNADPPPGVGLQNKTDVMKEYLFHLAFENGRVDDYITEKLWMSYHAGTIPVVLGPTNIKEHVGSFHGAIYVDDFPTVEDLAKYLIKVSNNQTLYESYHAWRKEPYPDKFLEKYNMTRVHNSCRLCRWAFAKKYGLGFNHIKQSLKPVALSRETCMKSYALKSPVEESWWDGDISSNHKLGIHPSTATQGVPSCLENGTISTARIGDDNLIRSVWSHDGATDMYLEGQLTKAVVLKLQMPIAHSLNSTQLHGRNIIWFQTSQSRISVVINAEGPGVLDVTSSSMITVSSSHLVVHIQPDFIPMRIRVISDDQDTLHKGASELQTYYEESMKDDVLRMPELFVLESQK